MTCSAFENNLTEVLAGELRTGAARAAIENMKRHAQACPECAAAEAWIELASLPVVDRDPIPDPGEAYWAGFGATVAQRIGADPRQRATVWRRFVVAAALVMALASGWFLRGWVAPGRGDPLAAADPRTAADWSALEEVIHEATLEELAAALRDLPGGLGWMPGVDELDDIDQDELLEWLEQMESEGRPTS